MIRVVYSSQLSVKRKIKEEEVNLCGYFIDMIFIFNDSGEHFIILKVKKGDIQT